MGRTSRGEDAAAEVSALSNAVAWLSPLNFALSLASAPRGVSSDTSAANSLSTVRLIAASCCALWTCMRSVHLSYQGLHKVLCAAVDLGMISAEKASSTCLSFCMSMKGQVWIWQVPSH